MKGDVIMTSIKKIKASVVNQGRKESSDGSSTICGINQELESTEKENLSELDVVTVPVNAENSIKKMLLELKVCENLKGYIFLIEAIYMYTQQVEGSRCRISSIYAKIANKHKSRQKLVEIAIQYAIENARDYCSTEILKKYLGNIDLSKTIKNKIFISCLAKNLIQTTLEEAIYPENQCKIQEELVRIVIRRMLKECIFLEGYRCIEDAIIHIYYYPGDKNMWHVYQNMSDEYNKKNRRHVEEKIKKAMRNALERLPDEKIQYYFGDTLNASNITCKIFLCKIAERLSIIISTYDLKKLCEDAKEEEALLQNKIQELFNYLLIKQNSKGYQYLRECILLICKNPEKSENFSKILYPEIAEKNAVLPRTVSYCINSAICGIKVTPTTSYFWKDIEISPKQVIKKIAYAVMENL